jgi:hypothetical protein
MVRRRVSMLSANKRMQLLGVLVSWGLVACCAMRNSADSTNASLIKSRERALSQQADKKPSNSHENETLEHLAAALRANYDVDRLFAWSGSEIDGKVLWSDHEGRLRRVNFSRENGEYQFQPNGADGDGPFLKVLPPSELESLSEYLSETEYPVKVDTLKIGDCTARVILLWRAENRSFSADRSADHTLALPGIRVVLTNGAIVESNSAIDFECWIPREVLVDDLNKDGVSDYCFVGDVGPIIYIWTLTHSCSFEPLVFIEKNNGQPEMSEFLEGRSLELKKGNSGYSIHVWSKVPFKAQYTEEVYRWNTTMRAFIPMPVKGK